MKTISKAIAKHAMKSAPKSTPKSEPRTVRKLLTEAAARRLPNASTKAKDLHHIEGHLWLQHTGEAMSFLYMVNAKELQASRIEVGLGSWQLEGESNLSGEGRFTRTWADARARSAELDAEVKRGNHPREVEKAFRLAMRVKNPAIDVRDEDPRNPPRSKQIKFRVLVIEFLEKSSTAQEWNGPRMVSEFLGAMRNHVYPILGDRLVHTIDSDDVYAVLTQQKDGVILWKRLHKMAKTVRQRLEKIFGYAKHEGYRRTNDHTNPAAWQNFEHRLASSKYVHVTKPRAHVKPEKIGDVWRALCARTTSQCSLALRLKLLTVPRTHSLIAAKWSEFDFEKATWTIPGARMKGDIQRKQNDFVIPLSGAAIELLKTVPGYKQRKGYVFPQKRPNDGTKHIGRDSMRTLINRMGYKGIFSPHGFRHTFSTWRADETELASEVAEACLSHINGEGSKVAAVYNQGTYLKRRREMMEAWAAYVTAPPKVVDISEAKKSRTRKAA